MYAWRKLNPDADSSTYNREYERVYASLDEGECAYIENKEYERIMEMKQRSFDNYNQSYSRFRPTKGAFGKSKFKR